MIIKNGKTISSVTKGSQAIEKIMKGTLVVYEAFKNLIASGVPPFTLSNCGGKDLLDYKLYGKSVQNGTPTTTTPIEIESVGDYDQTTGKYKIPVTITGKNLFNLEYLLSLPEDKKVYEMTLKPNTTYTASTIGLPGSNSGPPHQNRCLYINDSVVFDGYPRILTTDATGVVEVVLHTNYEASAPLLNGTAKVQLEEGTRVTNYEPYIEQTTNIFLDEPLRKIGDFTDYIDFKNKKVVRRIYNNFFTTVDSKSSTSETYGVFLINVTPKPYITGSSATRRVGYAQSNKFIQHTGTYSALTDFGGYIQSYITNSGANRLACTFNDTSVTTVAQAQAKIGNGFEAQYVLETPIEETIELPNIPTTKGTTILKVDTDVQPSNMEIVYKGK